MFRPSQAIKITLILSCFTTSFAYGQHILTACHPNTHFKYDLEQVEDPDQGIVLYNQYASGMNDRGEVRQDAEKHVLSGWQEDFYTNGKKLHKGFYENGSLVKFENFYPNNQLERRYKGKIDEAIELKVYYTNGTLREEYKWKNGRVSERHKFFSDGSEELVYETTKSGLLKVEQHFQKNGVMIKQIQLLDEVRRKYQSLTWTSKDNPIERIDYILDEKGNKIRHGTYKKFDRNGQLAVHKVYKKGEVTKVVKGEEFTSDIPVEYMAFDLNQNGVIAQNEITSAINRFFDEETIYLEQVNGLINYFFDQE